MVLEPWKQGSWDPAGGTERVGGCGQSCRWRQVGVWVGPSLTLLHDLHNLQNSVHVLPSCYQTLKHQHLVVVKHVAVWTAHHL